MRTIALVLAAVMLAADPQQPPPPRASGTVAGGVHAVLVDVVVRDRRGQPVRDLTQADFEVIEDGVPQTIGSFTPVFEGSGLREAVTSPKPAPSGTAGGAGAATPGGGGASPYGGPVVTALVFDRLSPEARRLAVQAAKGYVGEKTETPSYIGIFSVDLSLASYSPFTRNARVLRQALDRMGGRASSSLNTAEQQQARTTASQRAAEATQAGSAAIAGAGRAGGPGSAPAEAIFAQMESQTLKEFEVMERDQSGYATTNGLFAIISTLRSLPGRKSMILFSEGIAIPPAVQRLFFGVIDAANRANVSIYTMDAAGLRTISEQTLIRDQVNQAAGGGTGILGSEAGGAPLSKALEKNEDVLRQDPHFGLGTLAESTGGMIFDSTNNLRQGFDRVETDLRNYYLVGYSPSNEAYDGHFRNIDVKVKRPGVTVAARKGYYAVRDSGVSINPWEALALGELERKPVPNAFPVRAGSFLFPERDRPGLVPVVVDLKTAGLTFQPSADGKSYTSDFTVLVRFLDERNQVVRKVSQHYDQVSGPIGEIQRAKEGEVLFYREPELAPGLYTMETVVYDTPSAKSSVRLSTVEVPGHNAAALRMSSLVIVKRGETVPEKERRAENPLLVKDVILYPNLGDPVSKAAKELGFYFAIYPATGGPAPEAVLQLLLNDAQVAQVPMPLAAADASGRIQQVGRLPLDQIPPGTYDLRIVVKQGGAQVVRSTLVRITP